MFCHQIIICIFFYVGDYNKNRFNLIMIKKKTNLLLIAIFADC